MAQWQRSCFAFVVVILFHLFLGHTGLYLGFTPGSVVQDYS